jgi:NADH-quinone oxidoreductase subunit E
MQNKEVEKIIEKYNNDASSILAILQDIQAKEKYLPREALEYLEERFNIPISKIYRIATFYRAFSLTPRGRNEIHVCLGTACHVRGGQRVMDRFSEELGIAPGETTKDNDFTLGAVNCLGVCAAAPVVAINDKYHGKMNPANVGEIIAKYRADKTEAVNAKN